MAEGLCPALATRRKGVAGPSHALGHLARPARQDDVGQAMAIEQGGAGRGVVARVEVPDLGRPLVEPGGGGMGHVGAARRSARRRRGRCPAGTAAGRPAGSAGAGPGGDRHASARARTSRGCPRRPGAARRRVHERAAATARVTAGGKARQPQRPQGQERKADAGQELERERQRAEGQDQRPGRGPAHEIQGGGRRSPGARPEPREPDTARSAAGPSAQMKSLRGGNWKAGSRRRRNPGSRRTARHRRARRARGRRATEPREPGPRGAP